MISNRIESAQVGTSLVQIFKKKEGRKMTSINLLMFILLLVVAIVVVTVFMAKPMLRDFDVSPLKEKIAVLGGIVFLYVLFIAMVVIPTLFFFGIL